MVIGPSLVISWQRRGRLPGKKHTMAQRWTSVGNIAVGFQHYADGQPSVDSCAMHTQPGAYPGIGQGGGGHFSKFSTMVAKMSISISLAYSHGEVYIRMLLAYSVFL